MPCPVHDDCGVVETNVRYVCRKMLSGEIKKGGCTLAKSVCHRDIGPDVATAFFSEEGKTPILDGFISKRGRPFRGALFRKENGRHGFEFPPREPRKGAKKPAATKKKAAPKKAAPKKGSSKEDGCPAKAAPKKKAV